MANYVLEPDLPRGDVVAGDPAGRGVDRILLGRLMESGAARRLYLDVTGEQVVAILGKRGTGKSYTLGVLLEGLAAGKGSSQIAQLQTPRGGLVLDIMDIFWTSALPLSETGSAEVIKQHGRMKAQGLSSKQLSIDVWLPAGFERSDIDPPGLKQLRMKASDLGLDDWADLFNVDIYAEPRGMLIAEVVTRVGRDGYHRADGSFQIALPDFNFADLLTCLEEDSVLQVNFNDNTRRSVRQRIATYAALPLFQGQATPLAQLIQAFNVSVLMLSRVPDELKKVIVSVLLKRVMRERGSASFAQKRLDLDSRLSASERAELESYIGACIPRTWVLLDEAHVLAGTTTSVAGEALVKYAKEGRNYGLSLAVATQQPTALDARLTSQAETVIFHQLTSPSDAAVATQNIRSPLPSAIRVDAAQTNVDTLLRRLGQGEAVFSSGNAPSLPRLCVVSIRARITAHGGYEA
jgi:uncharacterized protein